MVPQSTAVRAATAGGRCRLSMSKKTAVSAKRTRTFSTFSSAMSSASVSSSRSGLAEELGEFKDRLQHLGPGRVGLSLDDDNGLATLILDNHERRNGENEGRRTRPRYSNITRETLDYVAFRLFSCIIPPACAVEMWR